jgi:hypothetical protein
MISFKCANSRCGSITELPAMPKKFVCSKCGVLNTPLPKTAGSGEEACGCLLPTGFEWKLPLGCIGDEDNPMYVTPDDATALTRFEWIEIFGYDPKAKLADMRRIGENGVPGFMNLSTLKKIREKIIAKELENYR